MSKTIKVRGVKADNSKQQDQSPIAITSKGRVLLGTSRDFGSIETLSGIEVDDIACVEYSNDFKVWTRVEDLYRENAAQTARGMLEGDQAIWEIELRFNTGAERGLADLTIKALEFFGVDLKGLAAKELCEWFEKKQLQEEGPGLYRLGDLKNNESRLVKLADKIDATKEPILLFIHGTGSSTEGGFGNLWEEAGIENNIWQSLHNQYGNNRYAYEHYSLTVSPIDNALAIAKALPYETKLHLVTHSRGGLVGELLCLGQRQKSPDPLQADLLDKLFDSGKDQAQVEEAYNEQKQKLAELRDILDKQKITITRFVRVACPALGTTLASGRLDRWLSLMHFLTGNNDLIGFLFGVIKKRIDPRTLPGLEAMMPGSALVRLLNCPELKVSADLTVIAGDIEGDSVFGKLKLQLVDWFFDDDHDLVVNTGSMYGGLKRTEGSRFYLDRSREVNHFKYFTNQATVGKLKTALLSADNELDGFTPMSEAVQKQPARGIHLQHAADMSLPLAIVLHGTMGCHLSQNQEHIWLNYIALSRGKLAELGITMTGIECRGLIEDYYGDFVGYLDASHRVEMFCYDWRMSIIDSADQLAQLVSRRLADCEAKRQPIRFVAHSMGGLVVRAMFSRHPELWKRFQALQGSRFMMLGTPKVVLTRRYAG